MKVVFNSNLYYYRNANYIRKNTSFKSASDLMEDITGLKRLKELGNAKTEAEGWKVAMKMADYGNPVRHAAWVVAGTKGAAIGAMLGPAGASIGFVVGAVTANYACNKVRNKVLDKAADWLEGE